MIVDPVVLAIVAVLHPGLVGHTRLLEALLTDGDLVPGMGPADPLRLREELRPDPELSPIAAADVEHPLPGRGPGKFRGILELGVLRLLEGVEGVPLPLAAAQQVLDVEVLRVRGRGRC
jgi:hypothetical protein